jgi:hypothetical protein
MRFLFAMLWQLRMAPTLRNPQRGRHTAFVDYAGFLPAVAFAPENRARIFLASRPMVSSPPVGRRRLSSP